MLEFEETLPLGKPVETFRRMVSDREFFARKYREMRLQKVEVLDHSIEGDVIVAVARYAAPVGGGLPPIAKKFVGDEVIITQTERWDFASGTASMKQEIKGAPARIGAEIRFGDGADGVEIQMKWSVAASVPIIGSKLEQIVGNVLRLMIKGEHRISRKLIAEYE